jgi:uncharacterized membrane protein YdjX (TVP38/TMEM64 family)
VDLVETSPSRLPLWLRGLFALMLLGLILAVYHSGLAHQLSWGSIRSQIDELKAWVERCPQEAVLLFVVTYIVVTALSLPVSTGMSIAAGALFGRWLGVALVSLSATVGATLSMWTSRYLFRATVERRFGHRLQPLFRGIERDGGWYLLSIRLVAVFPYFLVNLAMGLTPIRTGHYVLATWLGMLPANFLFVNAGRAIMAIESPGDVLQAEVIAALILLASVPLLVRFMVRRLLWGNASLKTPESERVNS